MKIAEFCAGYNGLGMAVEAVFDAEPGWFSEYDAAPSKILAHHYPGIRNYGDMTKIKWAPDCPDCGTMCAVYRAPDDSPYYWCSKCSSEWDISIRFDDPDADNIPEPADIHSGGTPCQDLSAAGKRRGMTEGTRSNLWVQMREAIATQRPRYVVWENVRGAYSATAASDLEQCPGCMGDTGDGGAVLRALGRVLGDLSDLGYDCQWRGLRAADVGACHSRYRVFVLAVDAGRIGRRESNLPAGISATSLDRATVPHEPDTRRVRPERQDASDSYLLGYKRGWEARGRRLGLADCSEPAPNAESIGRGEGRAESAGILRRLATASDSSPTADTDRGNDDGRLGNTQWSPERREAAARSSKGSGTASDSMRSGGCGRASESEQARGDHAPLGPDQGTTNWGDYEPAIRRWEARLGRPAPRPTEPTGRNGGHRLSPAFTEWMMGLPAGWVTDPAIGISRNEQLKACGNGVVPQQATEALRDMLAAFNTKEMAA